MMMWCLVGYSSVLKDDRFVTLRLGTGGSCVDVDAQTLVTFPDRTATVVLIVTFVFDTYTSITFYISELVTST